MSEPAEVAEPVRRGRHGERKNVDLMRLVALAAVEALSDGEWHSYPEVAKKVAAAIPPGVAKRRYESVMERKRAIAGTIKGRVLSDADTILRGRRMIVDDFLRESEKSFEISHKLKPGQRRADFIDDRKIRMLVRPRWADIAETPELANERVLPQVTVAELRDVLGFDALVRENRALHAEVRQLRGLLSQVGLLAARADREGDE